MLLEGRDVLIPSTEERVRNGEKQGFLLWKVTSPGTIHTCLLPCRTPRSVTLRSEVLYEDVLRILISILDSFILNSESQGESHTERGLFPLLAHSPTAAEARVRSEVSPCRQQELTQLDHLWLFFPGHQQGVGWEVSLYGMLHHSPVP